MRRIIPTGLLLVAVVAASQGGMLQGIDNALQDVRFSSTKRSATGAVVLVQIDAHSLNSVGYWPWPRTVHARLIDRLRAAGARDIALDIDFSHAARWPLEDDELEGALVRANGSVILPAFRQPLVSGDHESPVYVSRPLPRFARHSWPAIVNVWPQADGLVRYMERVSLLDGEAIASMAQLISGGTVATSTRFAVDYSINPASIPRVSASDVLDGSFDAASIAGKSVIVGATAVELGDRFAVPVYGIVAGAEFQTLAAESLLQRRAVTATGGVFVATSLAAMLLLLGAFIKIPNWRRDLALLPLVSIAIELVAYYLFNTYALALATTHLHLLIAGYLFWRGLDEINIRRLIAQIANVERDNSELLLGRVLNDSFDGVIVVNQDTKVLMVNRSAASFLRSSASGAPSGNLADLLAPGFASHAVGAVKQALSNSTGFLECEIGVTQDGAARYLELIATRSMLNGERAGRVVTLTFRDVTERRLAAEAIERAAEEAHAANRAKSSFLATVSHELRTPLNAIIGFSDILRRELFGKLGNDRYKEYADHIGDSGAHLLRIVNDILDITRIEAGNLSLMEGDISLRALFDDIETTFSGLPGGAERQFVATVEPDNLAVVADPQVLRQILLNLVSNAVKFTAAEGGRIDMRARCDNDGSLHISVHDNGSGIDAQHLPNLTKPFYQVDGRLARQHEGAGLGLALVNGYVTAHDGRLEIESKLGEGTTVTIWLPAARVQARRDAA